MIPEYEHPKVAHVVEYVHKVCWTKELNYKLITPSTILKTMEVWTDESCTVSCQYIIHNPKLMQIIYLIGRWALILLLQDREYSSCCQRSHLAGSCRRSVPLLWLKNSRSNKWDKLILWRNHQKLHGILRSNSLAYNSRLFKTFELLRMFCTHEKSDKTNYSTRNTFSSRTQRLR